MINFINKIFITVFQWHSIGKKENPTILDEIQYVYKEECWEVILVLDEEWKVFPGESFQFHK